VKQPISSRSVVEAPDDQRATAGRIAQSTAFSRSPRLREMFLYIMECTFSGRLDDLTETRIAENVFGRRDYHPSEDNIVRVSARQLRSKIAEYYQTEKQPEDLELEIPKGGYHAIFRKAPAAPPLSEPSHLPAEPVATPAFTIRHPAFSWTTVGLAALSCVLFTVLAVMWKENRQLRSTAAVPTLFDSLAANPNQHTQVVVTDSALILYEKLLGRCLTLEEYASSHYPLVTVTGGVPSQAEPATFSDVLRSRQISSLADMRILTALFQAYPAYARNLSVQHARHMHTRDFSSNDNFVLLGSARSNPWTTLFESDLTFRLPMQVDNSCFEDSKPPLNHPHVYCAEDSAHESGRDYARIVMRHNREGTGRVLLISGMHMESTEAAGKFFLDPRSVPQVLAALHGTTILPSGSPVMDLPDYELLLSSDSIGGAGRAAQIIYARRL